MNTIQKVLMLLTASLMAAALVVPSVSAQVDLDPDPDICPLAKYSLAGFACRTTILLLPEAAVVMAAPLAAVVMAAPLAAVGQ